ncbi:MAG: hypothetical protein Aureis2KO_10400 [Aureisphaera sp.]
MNTFILEDKAQVFIRNYKGDTTSLAFKGSPFTHITTAELITQIEGFRKSEKKLPCWHKTEGIYFPNKINLEQCSSEITAKYKASLLSGASLADITGGFGVDGFYFSKQFNTFFHFEHDQNLSDIAAHNFKVLEVENAETYCEDGIKAIENRTFDVIYADPARRHASKGKVFFLKDCEPDIVRELDYLMERCQTLLLKTSPMLDISAALADLKFVKDIHIVAVKNEVKELLWVLDKRCKGEIRIITQNFDNSGSQEFSITMQQEASNRYDLPQKYLYEPNAALMKAGNLDVLSNSFGIGKLHQHSHLFTSNELKNFPGRVFQIKEVIPYQKKNMAVFKNTKANVTIRNFPEDVATLRKKWRISDGGDDYLFFTTNMNNERIVLKCQKA